MSWWMLAIFIVVLWAVCAIVFLSLVFLAGRYANDIRLTNAAVRRASSRQRVAQEDLPVWVMLDCRCDRCVEHWIGVLKNQNMEHAYDRPIRDAFAKTEE